MESTGCCHLGQWKSGQGYLLPITPLTLGWKAAATQAVSAIPEPVEASVIDRDLDWPDYNNCHLLTRYLLIWWLPLGVSGLLHLLWKFTSFFVLDSSWICCGTYSMLRGWWRHHQSPHMHSCFPDSFQALSLPELAASHVETLKTSCPGAEKDASSLGQSHYCSPKSITGHFNDVCSESVCLLAPYLQIVNVAFSTLTLFNAIFPFSLFPSLKKICG